MRGNDISVRLAAGNPYHSGNNIGVRALSGVAVTSQNRSVTAQFDLKGYRQFGCRRSVTKRHCFPAKDYAVRIRSDDIDVIAGGVVKYMAPFEVTFTEVKFSPK